MNVLKNAEKYYLKALNIASVNQALTLDELKITNFLLKIYNI